MHDDDYVMYESSEYGLNEWKKGFASSLSVNRSELAVISIRL